MFFSVSDTGILGLKEKNPSASSIILKLVFELTKLSMFHYRVKHFIRG